MMRLRQGEVEIGLEEFMRRLSRPGRLWCVAGGTLILKTPSEDNHTNRLIGVPKIECCMLHVPLDGIDNTTFVFHDPKKAYVFTSKHEAHLSIRRAGDKLESPVLTLLDRMKEKEDAIRRRDAEEAARRERVKRAREEAQKKIEDQIRDFFGELPIAPRCEVGLGDTNTRTIILRREDGIRLVIGIAHPPGQPHLSFEIVK